MIKAVPSRSDNCQRVPSRNHPPNIIAIKTPVPTTPNVPDTHIAKKPQNTVVYDRVMKSFSGFI